MQKSKRLITYDLPSCNQHVPYAHLSSRLPSCFIGGGSRLATISSPTSRAVGWFTGSSVTTWAANGPSGSVPARLEVEALRTLRKRRGRPRFCEVAPGAHLNLWLCRTTEVSSIKIADHSKLRSRSLQGCLQTSRGVNLSLRGTDGLYAHQFHAH